MLSVITEESAPVPEPEPLVLETEPEPLVSVPAPALEKKTVRKYTQKLKI